jgi:hypothetical protein
MLIKIGKRGRKHGLGIVGISQRPADVKKDYITQCDWLVWHRLTWDNDTKVVRRIIDAEHAGAVEDLSDGEAFLMTDWSESVRRVQFHRKHTFDAGATPGLDDFERPDLKSVSEDLVSELQEISDERERRESELADLRQELERKERRIADLERELEEARDLSRMADRFTQAMLRHRTVDAGDGDGGGGADAGGAGGSEVTDGPGGTDGAVDDAETTDRDGASDADGLAGASFPVSFGGDGGGESASGFDDETGSPDTDVQTSDGPPDGVGEDDPAAETDDADADPPAPGTRDAVVHGLRSRVDALPDVSRRMLEHYREQGVADPVDAHMAAGGTPEEPVAYGRNRPLRQAGLVEHAGQGTYRYALPDRVDERVGDSLGADERESVLRAVERSFVQEGDLQPDESDGTGDGVEADGAGDGHGEGKPGIPPEEREDVEVVADAENVSGDDGFVAEDAAIIDDESQSEEESADDERIGAETADDDGMEDAPDDTGDVEIL